MANASQELMLRVRGDNSGADQAIAKTTKSLKGLSISGERAGGAFRNFSRTLSEAKTGADVAAGAADSLSKILGKSLAGAVAVGAVKLFTDQIDKMSESVKESALSASKAFDDIEQAGAAMSLAEAQSQVKGLETNIASLKTKLDDLDRSPFQNFIAKTTGAREQLEELKASQERLRDTELAAGLMSQNISEVKMAGLDEEEKALEKINQEYRDRDKVAAKMTDKFAHDQYQSESGDKFARDRNAELDKQAKARADKEAAYQKELFQAEMAASKFERIAKETADKEIADAKKALEEAAHKEAIYNIKEESSLEMAAEDRKFQRLLRDANTLRAEQKKTQEDTKKAQGLNAGLLGSSREGTQALEVARKGRARENKQADFKAQDEVFRQLADQENTKRRAQGNTMMATPGDMKRKMAQQQAASEAPGLSSQIQGQMTGVDPSEIASQQAQSRFDRQAMGMTSDLGPSKNSVEAQSQTKEVMTAIQGLVDLMKTATLVN